MSSMVQVLGRAAGFGAVVGTGTELIHGGEGRGRYFAIAVVAATALQAVACFFGWGAAAGAFLGGCVGWENWSNRGDGTIAQAVGYILVGACVGYVAELAKIQIAILL